ncbi:MAG TPA: hypothetical protein PKK06_07495 [Phycisphaerae bacterium]|nr:hypothetical protein [Phycisphaerae bacterium]HNU46600.1 hypothetical protein [Phycisphaerae bacterium]
MSEPLAEYLTTAQAGPLLQRMQADLAAGPIARVRNLEYVYAPCALYPLAPVPPLPLPRVRAFTVDMDGTSTTTEPLALHALEYMVRCATGRLTRDQWPGLDPQHDYPHVIGNSNYRHTEFLLTRYRALLDPAALAAAFLEALVWTLTNVPDPQRRREITRNARQCGFAALLADTQFQRLTADAPLDWDGAAAATAFWRDRYAPALRAASFSQLVSVALDVYYYRYHGLLALSARHDREGLQRALPDVLPDGLVAPMPGYDVFLPLVKGWLGADARALFEPLRAGLLASGCGPGDLRQLDAGEQSLVRLAQYFEQHPARVALVTASIGYEMHAVIKELLAVLVRRVAAWPVPPACRERVAASLADERLVYDALICASDACEPRLKPHPDLYSLALYELGVPRAAYTECIGLEDTEPGIIALRAAGIGCAVALPNRDTTGQNYTAAARVVRGGLPELMLIHNLLVAEHGVSP